MKKLKKIIALFTAALFVLLPIFSNTLTVQAEENPVTYYIKYVESEQEWRYQPTSWDDSQIGRDLYYMHTSIKDGDLVVIDGNTSIDLEVGVRLSNLTVANSTLAVVKAKSIDDFYLINNSTAAITGDVTNGYVYGYSVANFNTNITNLYIVSNSEHDDPDATLAVVGKAAHLKAYDASGTYYEYYNFKENTLRTDKGTLTTASENFSQAPSAEAPAPAAPTTQAAPTTTTPAASAGELDDVPKTGDFSINPLWFLGIAVACMLGYYKLEKR